MNAPTGTLGLVWIFGFSSSDVFAVGKCGAMIHYDGMTWSSITLPNSLLINGSLLPDLWGIWGQSRDNIWIIGGLCFLGQPVLIHYNANTNTFTKVDPFPPTDNRDPCQLLKVWGTGSKIFSVGENGSTLVNVFVLAVIYHFDGSTWKQMNAPTGTLGLVWIFGFSSSDVFAVGKCGAMIHYDGMTWSSITLPNSLLINGSLLPDLWGIWGQSRDNIWIIGGLCFLGQPVLIHYNANTNTFTKVDPFPPTDNRDPCQLLKVWGTGSKIFSVGENGVILEHQGMNWIQYSTGAITGKFVSLWGTSQDNVVAVGWDNGNQIAKYNGTNWAFYGMPSSIGLNAVFMDEPNLAVIGGDRRFLGRFDPTTNMIVEESPVENTQLQIHAIWGDHAGRYYAVGATNLSPYNEGICLVRTYGPPGFTPAVPLPPAP